MTFRSLGPDPLAQEVEAVLAKLAAGHPPSDIETRRVDFREEPNRRARDGSVLPGRMESEQAAELLARESACLANTEGSGALILGVADDGQLIGTELRTEWLRHRIFELSDRRLTVEIREFTLNGARLLLLRPPEAIEPVDWRGRIRWRVDDHCVDVNPSTWWAGRMRRTGCDWSAQPSGYGIADARASALELARESLRDTDEHPGELSLTDASDADLLRRLNLVTAGGMLTNAGALLFVTTPVPAIDYIRRDYPAGDSTQRLRPAGPLLNQLAEVELAATSANRIIHLPDGFVSRQVRAIPASSVREAIVNGVVHRNWQSEAPTVVEHVGDTLTVTSPGGFPAGITADNIISHPSTPRYRSLAEAMVALKLAEREGIGIDRMVAAGLASGHIAPVFSEITGPSVRVVLVGGVPDTEWLQFLGDVRPKQLRHNVDVLLVLDSLASRGWSDLQQAARIIQKHEAEAAGVFSLLESGSLEEHALLVRVRGVPPDQPDAWRLSDEARRMLTHRMRPVLEGDGRQRTLVWWIMDRGRVSSTEAADLLGVSVPTAGRLLQELEAMGLIEPSRQNRRGSGFHYVPVTDD